MAASGEDKDFKKQFDQQYNYLKKDERKYKNKNPEVSREYAEAAAKLKQRYEARSPNLMNELKQYHALDKLREAVLNRCGPIPK